MSRELQGRPIKRESVAILLHEYDTLRTEITHKTNNMYQVVAVASAALIALVNGTLREGHFSRPPDYVWAVFLVMLAYAYFWWMLARDIKKAAARLREIEETVDQATGEWYLLRYERLSGGGARGYAGLSHGAPVPPESKE